MPESDARAELAAEQSYVDAAYRRLEAMRRSASRVSEAYADVRRGGTHQARLERDIAVELTHRRLAALDIGDAPLLFGRLDLAEPGTGLGGGTADGRLYVGRLGVDDADHTPLVVDWRAPVAEPFYRATAVESMGVVRRRHFVTRHGRELVGLDDEVFDADAAAAAGFTVLGDAALMAALNRQRTGRMGDIVATIQAEQDEAIRAGLPGVLVVAGGAGTGKTAVALHRAAYLLYTHRRKLQANGVLLVGPSSVFLRYIEQVLPSLGEHDVHLSTLAALKQLRVDAHDAPAVAAVKGDARMVAVIAKAIDDRQRGLPRDMVVDLDGLRLRITRRDSSRIVARARRRGGPRNGRRPFVTRLLLDHLVDRYRAQVVEAYRAGAPFTGNPRAPLVDAAVAGLLARGAPPPVEWERELRARLRRTPTVREALERMWPVLDGAEVVHDLFGFPALVRSAADGVLTPQEQRSLHRPRGPTLRDVAWTEADVALVDEADALLGPVELARPARRRRRRVDGQAVEAARRVVDELGLAGRTTAEALAGRFAEPAGPVGAGRGEPRSYGHVLVDEAQDLTPMQWRMIARRAPSGSLTLVGDFGQASRPGAASGWDDVLRHLPGRRAARTVHLSVNYRTPAEIMEVAHRLLTVAAPRVEPTRAVRSTGRRPRFVAVAADALVAEAARLATHAHAEGGTVAVIAPPRRHGPLTAALAGLHAVANTPNALDAPVAVLDALGAKGLEFDHVIVVEPAELVTPEPAGLRLLYVALTRATRTLAVVHAAPLPEALLPGHGRRGWEEQPAGTMAP